MSRKPKTTIAGAQISGPSISDKKTGKGSTRKKRVSSKAGEDIKAYQLRLQIAEGERHAAARSEADALARLCQAGEEVSTLRRSLFKAELESRVARSNLQEIRHQIGELQQGLEHAELSHASAQELTARLDAIEASTSWRLTAPLRRLMEYVRRLKEKGLPNTGGGNSNTASVVVGDTLLMHFKHAQYLATEESLASWNTLLSVSHQEEIDS